MKTNYLLSLLSFAIFLFSPIISEAQGVFELSSDAGSDDEIIRTHEDFDGSIVSLGNFNASGGNNEMILTRRDSSGALLNSTTYGTSDNEFATDFIQLPDSGWVIAGYTKTPVISSEDGMMIRLDKNGAVLWSMTYPVTGKDIFNAVALTADGNLCAVGSAFSSVNGYQEARWTKVDLNGNQLWSWRVQLQFGAEVNAVASAKDGNIYVTGQNSIYEIVMKLNSLTGDIIWSNKFQTSPGTASGEQILLTPDDGVLFLGTTSGFGAGVTDISFVKTDSSGNFEWMKTYGGQNEETSPAAIEKDNGYMIVAETESFGGTIQSGLLLKTSLTGTLLWGRTVDHNNYNYMSDISVYSDGAVMVSGHSSSVSNGSSDFVLQKLSALGSSDCSNNPVVVSEGNASPGIVPLGVQATDPLSGGSALAINVSTTVLNDTEDCPFSQKAINTFQKVLGMPSLDTEGAIAQSVDGGYYMSASSSGGPHGGYDIMVSRMDELGDTLWTGLYGLSGDDFAKDIIGTNDGGALIMGRNTNPSTYTYLLKLDGSGNIEWTNQYTSGNPNRMIQLNDGNFLIAASIGSNMGVIKIDGNGNVVWEEDYVQGTARDIFQAPNGEIVLAGFDTGSGSAQIRMVKMTESGNFIWAKEYDAGGNDYLYGVTGNNTDYYLVGYTTSFSAFNQGFAIHTDSTGSVDWSNVYLPPGSGNYNLAHAKMSNNELVVSGAMPKAYLGKISGNTGAPIWGMEYDNTFGGGGRFTNTLDGGYVAIYSANNFTNGSFDQYVVKTDSLGQSLECHENPIAITTQAIVYSESSLSPSSSAIAVVGIPQTLIPKVGIVFYLDLEIVGSAIVQNVDCAGGADGVVDLTSEGGVTPYTYTFNGAAGSNSNTNLSAGTYAFEIIDDQGCVYTDSVEVTEPLPISIMISADSVSCNGFGDGSANASVSGGTTPYNYLWNVGQQDTTAIGLFAGTYIMNVVDDNGCFGTNLVEVFEPDPITLSFTSASATCGSNNGMAEVAPVGGTPSYSALWNGSVSGFTINSVSEGFQTVQITDGNGCVQTDSIFVGTVTNVQELCIITVDTNSAHNQLIWEKDVVGNIDGYKVYRNIAGTYSVIGYSPYDSLSVFTDLSFGVDPNITSYRYKISAVDSCGSESALSDFHETIHLTVNQGTSGEANLIWDNYEGFAFNYYRILRDSTGLNDWEVLDSVTNNNFTYTDLNVPNLGARYTIEIVAPSSCTSTRANHNTTRSNKTLPVAGPGTGNGIESMISQTFKLYPNPNRGQFIISFKSMSNKNSQLRVFNATGSLILEESIVIQKGNNEHQMTLNELAPGVYFVEIDSTTRERFMVGSR